MNEKIDLLSLTPEELRDLMLDLAQPGYRAAQIFRWLQLQRVSEFEEMKNLPQDLRERLKEKSEAITLQLDTIQKSKDGTCKFRFLTHDGHAIESVYIPEWEHQNRPSGAELDLDDRSAWPPPDRKTLCVSSQIGCAMGCDFCMTATLGLVRNLRAGEMVAQVHAVNRWLKQEGHTEPRPLGNLVFMGMGEPLHNYEELKRALTILLHQNGANFSHRHVTVSTSGLVPALERLGKETEVKIALSITGTTDEVRDRLMPVNRRWPLEELLKACRKLPIRRGRRITIEYVLLEGVSDSLEDANRLANMLKGLAAKVNLIAFNDGAAQPGDGGSEGKSLPISGPASYRRPSAARVEAFRERLSESGLSVVVRRSRGLDIDAACGQLAAKVPKAG